MPYIGNSPATGENNSFKILDDIKTYTLTFDGSSASVVSVADDTITSNNHRFITGQRVTYTDGTGTAIGGLTDGTVYYIIKNDQNTIKLATSQANANAGTAIDITALGTGTNHTLNVAFDSVNTKFKATYDNGTKALVTRAAQLTLSVNGVIQEPQDTTTPTNGFGIDIDGVIIFSVAPVNTDTFWGNLVANNFPTFDIADNTIDNFTGNGSTTVFTLSKAPPNNQNILVTLDGVVQYPSDATTTRSYSVTGNTLTFDTAPGNGVDIQVRHIGFAGATSSAVTGFYGRTGNVGLTTADNVVVNNIFVGSATSTGTASQPLQVTGGAYVSGNLGIGATNPLNPLHIFGSGQQTANITDAGNKDAFLRVSENSNNVGAGGGIIFANNQSDLVASAGFAAIKGLLLNGSGNTTGHLAFSTRTTTGATSLTEQMRIDSTGKVGIGNTNPAYMLDVAGLLRIGALNTTDAGIEVGNGATGNRFAYVDLVGDTTYTDWGTRLIRGNSGANTTSTLQHRGTGKLEIRCDDAGTISFLTSNTERMQITSDGRVYIGHNTSVGSAGIIAPIGYLGRAGTSGAFANVFNIAWTGSVANLWIDTTNLGAIQVSSDYRIKKNVQTQAASAIERIKLLRPVTYELKNYENLFYEDGVQREGFIAHEVQEVIPSGVEGEKDEENRVQSLRLDAIVSVLTKALQEAVTKIEVLESKVASLEDAQFPRSS